MPRREPVTVMKAVTPARQGNFKLRLNGEREIGLSPFYVYLRIFLLNHAQWRQPEQYRMSQITLSEASLNCACLYVAWMDFASVLVNVTELEC